MWNNFVAGAAENCDADPLFYAVNPLAGAFSPLVEPLGRLTVP